MPYGVWATAFGMSPLRAAEQLDAHRSTGGEERLDARESGAIGVGQRSGRGHDVRDRGGGQEHDARVEARTARTAAATAPAVRVRGAETSMSGSPSACRGRAQEREGGEAGHETGVGGHTEVRGEGVAQRSELSVRVHDALSPAPSSPR